MLDTNPSFEAVGGYLRDEAIMLLRKFYMSENQNGESCVFALHTLTFSAPNPKKKATRVLKTDIPPPPTLSNASSRPASAGPASTPVTP